MTLTITSLLFSNFPSAMQEAPGILKFPSLIAASVTTKFFCAIGPSPEYICGPETSLNSWNVGGEKLETFSAFSIIYWTWNDSPGAIGRCGTTVLKFTCALALKV